MLTDVRYALKQLRGISVDDNPEGDRIQRAIDALERVEAELGSKAQAEVTAHHRKEEEDD